jgi:phosphoribosylanthranilate isomerase
MQAVIPPNDTPTQVRTRVKICGLTRVEDIRAAVSAGVDALGFVFVPASRRALTIDQARLLFAELPPFVQSVALFLDPDTSWVQDVIEALGPDLLQFHGAETGIFCRQFSRPYIKAIGTDWLTDSGCWSDLVADHSTARGFLLDSHVTGELGGSGATFDWSHWPQIDDQGHHPRQPLILAGGLTAHNVSTAISAVHPYGVDVSSGVEFAPGIKSAEKIQEFMSRVNHAN